MNLKKFGSNIKSMKNQTMNNETISEAIVIGAGAAGMFAAGILAKKGITTFLFEKNQRPGRKLMITGKGRCNVTNNQNDLKKLIENVVGNGKFLYSAFSNFLPKDTIAFFEDCNVPLKTERGNRVYPVSDKSVDIVDALYNFIKKNNVKIINEKIISILIKNGKAVGVITDKGVKYYSKSIIVATGGVSYPSTGSTGDGYAFANAAGHNIIKPRGSLVGLCCLDNICNECMGLSLKNVGIEITDINNKIVYKDFGELLFTHFGVSGPTILSASAFIRDISPGKYKLNIDLKPALNLNMLDERLIKEFSEQPNISIGNVMCRLLPRPLINEVLHRAKVNNSEKVNQISKAQRLQIAHVLKNLTIQILNYRPKEEAIITAGGVSTKEINPKTMKSKFCEGLYFAGEVIDVDAYTGGYNLQIAFSTAYTAAKAIIKEFENDKYCN